MLTVEPIVGEKNEAGWPWQQHALLLDGSVIGRIDLYPSNRAGMTEPSVIQIDDCRYRGRIVDRGKARWTYVPARWVLCREEAELHSAERRGAREFRIEAPATAQPLRLYRERWSANFTLQAADDGELWCSATIVRRRLMPVLRLQHYRLAFEKDLPIIFQAFIAWIILQDAIDESDG